MTAPNPLTYEAALEAMARATRLWTGFDGQPALDVRDAILAAAESSGFVLAPKEPTDEMLDEAWADALAEDARGVWRSMIESSRPSSGEA